MSSLRRFAQTNAAVSASPRAGGSTSASTAASPTTPVRGNPTTPRARLIYPISPVTSPSLSASQPFDWEAARSRRPPPYSTPSGKRKSRSSDVGTPGMGTPGKRVVRKKSLYDRITSIPSQISFEISQFPNNVPLPSPENSAWIIGGTMHFLHLCVRVSQIRRVPDSDLGWEDMYREGEGEAWFDWTVPMTFILVSASIVNALFLFTRMRVYYLNLAAEPVSSPHASFVKRPRTPHRASSDEPAPRRSLPAALAAFLAACLSALWRGLRVSVRFLLNLSPPKARAPQPWEEDQRVQQLEVWTPGALEMALFGTYSPVHALLWMALTSANWMMMFLIMFMVGVQTRALSRSYEAMLKDKAIIAAEVLHEYDQKFVYPRVNPIRKDASVMTHESEMVDVWE
ncbi:uncharacterized protein TRAVEDRAFT_63775 [Trametes versicolor FP-101664 SS1]|uniref:uncharacterized protein n=1 Tax=Trametes versicolor (strain FP-101664) TaxID=717944 RepID=UPI00046240AB|nr:uncharacterized protein TRAVEDRAFT_63775 [Trametes versicolor FP-101664 SS1]EIW60092.1 hypothetical protein TRAVEDRAFT_63775 [Trametes versicolor FP-101664 SS1]